MVLANVIVIATAIATATATVTLTATATATATATLTVTVTLTGAGAVSVAGIVAVTRGIIWQTAFFVLLAAVFLGIRHILIVGILLHFLFLFF